MVIWYGMPKYGMPKYGTKHGMPKYGISGLNIRRP